MENVIIRKAKFDEFINILPMVAFKAYYDRFYNIETIKKNSNIIRKREGEVIQNNETEEEFLEYGGCLSIPYTKLSPKANGTGQSLLSFTKYWLSKIKDFQDEKFKVFVAEVNGKIVGFIKGTFDKIDKNDFPDCKLEENKNLFALGSLYILPSCRKKGIGTMLTKEYIKNLLKEHPNCDGMLTECYWRNNSQYFFNKLGAESIGFCNITDLYLNEQLELATQNITGEVMFWDRNKLDLLANNRFTNKEYNRKTKNYVKMLKFKGNFEEYLRNKQLIKGVEDECRIK